MEAVFFLFTVIVFKKNVIPNKKKRTNQAEYVCTLTCVSVACDHCSSTEAVHFLVSSTVQYTVQWLFHDFLCTANQQIFTSYTL